MTRRTRALFPAARRRALAAASLCAVAACGGGDGAQGTKAASNVKTFAGGPAGGTVIYLSDREPDNLNPLTFDSSPAFQVVHLLFRALARRDSTLSHYVPDLLERWEPGTAPNTLVLHVRHGLKWHDGVPVTAQDVVFTIQMQQSAKIASPRKNDVQPVKSVSARDSFTVDVALDRPGISTVNALLEVVPVPKHLLEKVDPAQMRFAPFSTRPVGNGLFRFEKWDRGQQLVVSANADAPEGRPALDRVVMRFVPDVNAAMTDLLAGNGDGMKVPADQKARTRGIRTATLYNAPRVRPAWIAWNVAKPPVDDPRVRRAVAMAINRPDVVQRVFGAEGEALLTPLPPRLAEHDPGVHPLPYDPVRAGAALDSAGWKDTNADGIRDKGGRPLRLTVEYNSGDQNRRDALVAMQATLHQVGVDLQLQPYESTTWVERLRHRDFQGSFWGWGWGPGVLGPNAVVIWSSKSIPPNGANFAGYANPKLDQLLDAVVVESDPAKAKQLWTQIEQTVVDDAVYLPIYLDPEYYGVSSRIANVKMRGIEWWEDIPYWYVPTDKRIARDGR
ncbi:MAG: ABC-type transport system, substrate-binding protein [Gemmatimonadetes bacterium]|nr:ABC-type transport system, substrate-binding protein [Gemmatimonadota bacterium]